MLKSFHIIAAPFLLFLVTAASFSQKPEEYWGCSKKDYKCQLDKRMAALQSDPKNPENYYNVALVFQRSGACKEAVESFSLYIAIPGLKPELRADGLNNRGICQRRLGHPDLALADHNEAIRLNPKNPSFYNNRANDNLDLKRSDEALADYGRAIAVDPKSSVSYANRGRFYFVAGKTDEAVKDLTQAIELDPKNAEAFYTRALVYKNRSEFPKVIADLDKYLVLDLDDPQYAADGYVNRAIAYAMTGKLEEAVRDASKAIEITPKYVDAYQVRAIVYRKLKKDNLAAADEKMAATLTEH